MPTPAEDARLERRRRRKVRGFQNGTRVMGDPDRPLGVVVGHTDDGLSVIVWWDGGERSIHSPHGLTIVAKDRA